MDEEINQFLLEFGLEDASYFVNPSFKSAIVGSTEEGGIIYNYDLMVEDLVLTENMSVDDAIEFIDFNTLRTIPYMDGIKPTILYPFPYNLTDK